MERAVQCWDVGGKGGGWTLKEMQLLPETLLEGEPLGSGAWELCNRVEQMKGVGEWIRDQTGK